MIVTEVTIAVTLILLGLYIILFPKKPKKLTAEDLILKENNNDVDQLPK